MQEVVHLFLVLPHILLKTTGDWLLGTVGDTATETRLHQWFWLMVGIRITKGRTFSGLTFGSGSSGVGPGHQRFYRSSQVVLPGVRCVALVNLDSTFQVGHFFRRKVVVCAQLCLPNPPAFSLSFLCTPVPPQHKGILREMPPTTACHIGPRLLRISSFCSGVLRVLIWRAVWWCR